MMKTAPLFFAALFLAGCATPSFVSPVEVTRFAAPQASFGQASLGRGTISISAAPGTDASALGYAAFADAVSSELTSLGYNVVAQGGAQVALVSLSQRVSQPDRRSPVSVGGGGSVGSYGSGVGLGIGLNLSPRPAEAIETQLSLAIRPASGGTNLWEGRASMSASANSDYGTAQATAARMADALLQGFPAGSGETILVE